MFHIYNYFEYQTIFILSNTIILSKFPINRPNIPIYQHFLHSYLLHHHPSPTLKISPFMPTFQQNLELPSKYPKIHHISCLITSIQITQSKKNPLKIKDSYYFPAYPDHIPPNPILLNHILTILFCKLSYNSRLFYTNTVFHIFRTELFTESIFIPFHAKKKPQPKP